LTASLAVMVCGRSSMLPLDCLGCLFRDAARAAARGQGPDLLVEAKPVSAHLAAMQVLAVPSSPYRMACQWHVVFFV
jgi:hypothetical protein